MEIGDEEKTQHHPPFNPKGDTTKSMSKDTPNDFDSVIDSMPDPTPGVAEREQAKSDEQEQREQEYKETLKDADGNPFDAEMHVTDADGNPVLTSRGKLRKRPGRGKGAGSRIGGRKSAEEQQAERRKLEARKAGAVAATVFMNGCITIGGEDFKPRNEQDCGYDEKDMMQTAFSDYFEAKGWTDFPPGIALAFVTFAYVTPRFTMPKTKGRMAKFAEAFKQWKRKRDKKKEREQKEQDKAEGNRGFFGGKKKDA